MVGCVVDMCIATRYTPEVRKCPRYENLQTYTVFRQSSGITYTFISKPNIKVDGFREFFNPRRSLTSGGLAKLSDPCPALPCRRRRRRH